MPGHTPIRTILAAAAGAALLWALPVAAGAEETLPSINLPLQPWTAVALKKGILKEEFDKIGTHQIKLLNPGTAELSGAEAALLDRGGLAVAERMMYPATVHRANGLDAVVVWQSAASDPYRTPVLALKDSPVNSVADLAGKTLGSSRVGCGWTSPMEILETAGVPMTTRLRQGAVQHETITSSAGVNAALLSGRISATATHVALPAAAALWATGQVKVIGRSPADGVYVNAAGRVSYFAMRPFVDKFPQAVRAFLVARERTKAWIENNIDEAAEIIARETRVPLHIAKFEITDPSSFEFMPGESSADDAANAVRTFQQWYLDHGDDILAEHHLTDDQIAAFVDRRFFKGGEYSVYD